jgi:hypothetical protein
MTRPNPPVRLATTDPGENPWAVSACAHHGKTGRVRIGNWDVRPLGGALGCAMMVLVSILASIVLTVLVNWLL